MYVNTMKLLSVFLFFISFSLAKAHQPVINDTNPNDPYKAYLIEKPEISKAIYSNLKGEPHYYLIESEERFNFYVGITVPKIDDCDTFKKFSFSILDGVGIDENIIEEVDGQNFEWWSWFEPYGKKWYWIGPEIGADFKSNRAYEPGSYYIKVYNETNTGNYVLATGDIEKFGPLVIAKLPIIMPKVNKFCDTKHCTK